MSILRLSLYSVASLCVVAALVVGYGNWRTEATIAAHVATVEAVAMANPVAVIALDGFDDLPEPVQRYFQFSFPEAPEPIHVVAMTMAGEFRRPRTEGFAATTAEQTIAVGTPALAFAATTAIVPGVWARAYDAYADGEMEMKARILSTLTVVDERETPELNRISLRRWLLESPLYPEALLPGGPVRWEAVDEQRARAVVAYDGLEATLLATFRADGSLERFEAEEDGDLDTPYHGSGEYVLREDYQWLAGAMRPMAFTIARAAGGEVYPFWRGELTSFSAH